MKTNFTTFTIPLLLLILLLGVNRQAKAQTYVTIPDANFVTFLQTNYPSCMNGNQMDITCPGITDAVTLDVHNKVIASMEGVQYFTSLTTLDCRQNNLTTLPALPAGLLTLHCSDNQLTMLPTLPAGLQNLSCYNNQLTALPAFPAGVQYLLFGNNPMTALPPLPAGLLALDCSGLSLTALPTLPAGLQELYCSNNQLITLPAIPASLMYLYCSYNQLTVLPALPPGGLDQLHCDHNQLTAIPENACYWGLDCSYNQLTEMPPFMPHMQYVDCSHNQLTALPDLNHVEDLDCSYNQLTALPNLPMDYMAGLNCSNNQIPCFPPFPVMLNYLDFSNNPYTCVANYVPVMTTFPPLCTEGDPVNNPGACAGIGNITGRIHVDNNENCLVDGGDTLAANIILKLYDDQDQFISQLQGPSGYQYGFEAAAFPGTYRVELDTVNKPYTVLCAPGIDSLVTLSTTNPAAVVDFSIQCKPGFFDIGCRHVLPGGAVFPGQQHWLRTVVGDFAQWYNLACPSSTISGTVTIDVSGPVAYSQPHPGSLAPSSVNGNQLTYTIADFSQLDAWSLLPRFSTDTTAQSGDQVCVHVSVAVTQSGDQDPTNNEYDFCYLVSNSYDPNFKEVYPVNVAPGYEENFTYTIHFQNTGNAPAYNIRLADTLDANLDNESFEVIGYSHPCRTRLRGDVVSFFFDDIMLPDSLSDPEGSIGYVQYRIKPKAGLPAGTQIENTAYIYFDYNAPIVTNTTVNEFVEPGVGIAEQGLTQPLIYPNPGKGLFTLQFPESGEAFTVEAFTMVGEKLMATTGMGKTQLDLSNYPNGIYLFRISGSEGTYSQRVVKQ